MHLHVMFRPTWGKLLCTLLTAVALSVGGSVLLIKSVSGPDYFAYVGVGLVWPAFVAYLAYSHYALFLILFAVLQLLYSYVVISPVWFLSERLWQQVRSRLGRGARMLNNRPRA